MLIFWQDNFSKYSIKIILPRCLFLVFNNVTESESRKQRKLYFRQIFSTTQCFLLHIQYLSSIIKTEKEVWSKSKCSRYRSWIYPTKNAHSHRGAASQVQTMQLFNQLCYSSKEPHHNSQWRKKPHLCTMQQSIQSIWKFGEASTHSHWREEAQVHTMQLFNQ